MARRLITVAIPAVDHKAHAATVDSLMAEQVVALSTNTAALLVIWERGCSSIRIARNRLIRDFLHSGVPSERLVMVDADISWNGGDLLKLANRPEDVIGGTYIAKTDKERLWQVNGTPQRSNGAWTVDGLPGGFLAISRNAAQQMWDAAPKYTERTGKLTGDLFPEGFWYGQMLTEDFAFSAFWRSLGGSVYLDPSIRVKHWDGGRVFEADPAELLQEAR